MRKKKRTAGQRRFIALQKRTEQVRCQLRSLQCSMQSVDGEGKQLRQMHIMQKLTEAIERLTSE